MAPPGNASENGHGDDTQKAAYRAAYLETYGEEEAETLQMLRYATWMGAGICVVCGVIMGLLWHSLIMFCVGMGSWICLRMEFRKQRKAARLRRQQYGLD
ncbi:hypothetical protein A0U94_05950 [Gluconobacter albidus]|uniref:hypothetical protein n=1 Tax=Gluconobacter albidus TaxID=318683 RepID=UPI00098AEABF|nr:hypothetical protein [Gluconobacter albidus]AQS90580.1 hypothetical protein A0U94_05950 [Gluconobacter albidus]